MKHTLFATLLILFTLFPRVQAEETIVLPITEEDICTTFYKMSSILAFNKHLGNLGKEEQLKRFDKTSAKEPWIATFEPGIKKILDILEIAKFPNKPLPTDEVTDFDDTYMFSIHGFSMATFEACLASPTEWIQEVEGFSRIIPDNEPSLPPTLNEQNI